MKAEGRVCSTIIFLSGIILTMSPLLSPQKTLDHVPKRGQCHQKAYGRSLQQLRSSEFLYYGEESKILGVFLIMRLNL